MFKLIKILNSDTNVPEPEIFPCDPDIEVRAGAALMWISEKDRVSLGSDTDKPYCILLADHKKNEDYALGYRITPNMIFEVPIVGDPELLVEGRSYSPVQESLIGYIGICELEEYGSITLLSKNHAKEQGDKLLV